MQAKRQRVLGRQAYASTPADWIEHVLGEHLWSKQREIAQTVWDNRRTAVPSAHEVGKSFLAGRLAAAWIETHPAGEAFVLTTAPTAAQVRAILWREINRAHNRGGLRGHTNQTEWWLNGEMVAMGRKPSDYDPSALQGIHAPYVLVIIDEAGGVPKEIFDAAGSLAANDSSRILAIGNPDFPHSHFATVCRPGSGWATVHVDGLESPNFTGEWVPEIVSKQLIGKEYERELREEAGIESAVYQSKVRGRFALDSPGSVVPLSNIRACMQGCEHQDRDDDGDVDLGVDVGAGGDLTTIRERRGHKVGRRWGAQTPRAEEATDLVLTAIRQTGAKRVKVDSNGVGWGIWSRLDELRSAGEHDAVVISVNAGSSSSDPSRFPKLRDQMWWQIGRELTLDAGWCLDGLDDRTCHELSSPKYVRDSANRIHVESKAETIKRLHHSPDDADALLMAYYEPVVEPGHGILLTGAAAGWAPSNTLKRRR
jgi:hypothetical protein